MTCFGEAAQRLCGLAAQLVGWRPEEFWNCTPTEIILALGLFEEPPDAPDAKTIETLRRRFPDDEKR